MMKLKDRPRILVIEDDPRVLEAIVLRLKAAGCECLQACRGDDGLGRYSMERIDLIITDLNMPGLDGIGLIRLIRATSDVPVIIVTGHADAYRDAMGMLHDITLMAKPFDTQTLLRRVESELTLANVPTRPPFTDMLAKERN